jgi:hypothetical protein
MSGLWFAISVGSGAVLCGPEISRVARRLRELVKKGTEMSEKIAAQERLDYIQEARREQMEALKKEIQADAMERWRRQSSGRRQVS